MGPGKAMQADVYLLLWPSLVAATSDLRETDSGLHPIHVGCGYMVKFYS